MTSLPTLAILGGTGHEGSGLGFRWAAAGHSVILGSRNPEKAADVARELSAKLPAGKPAIRGTDNKSAARDAQIVIMTVPYAVQQATAQEVRAELEGKILVDVTVPLVPPKVNRVQLPAAGSAVEALQKTLGAGVKVVSAFQNVSAHHLKDLAYTIDCDVLVCGDDIEACKSVIALVRATGMRGYRAGVLANSAAAEAMTSVLIAMNQFYKVPSAGIRITGIPEQS